LDFTEYLFNIKLKLNQQKLLYSTVTVYKSPFLTTPTQSNTIQRCSLWIIIATLWRVTYGLL